MFYSEKRWYRVVYALCPATDRGRFLCARQSRVYIANAKLWQRTEADEAASLISEKENENEGTG